MCNSVGDYHLGQTRAKSECVIPDLGDAQIRYRSWNLNRANGISLTVSNRHRRAVGVDRISIRAKGLSRSVA